MNKANIKLFGLLIAAGLTVTYLKNNVAAVRRVTGS